MNTWYIFNVSTDRVWVHNLASCGKRCFAIDIDGEYHPDHFGYKSKSRAEAQAASLDQMNAGEIIVIDREELFSRKGIVDRNWSHLKHQPTPAQRHRQEAREAREAEAACRAAMRLSPRSMNAPAVAV